MSQPAGRFASDAMNVVLVLGILAVIWLCFGDLIKEKLTFGRLRELFIWLGRLPFRRGRRTLRHYTAETLTPAAPPDVVGPPSPLTPGEDVLFRELTETFRLSGRKITR